MIHVLRITGWALRASALICIVWTAAQVATGEIATLSGIAESMAFHAAFAMSGVALVGQARRMSGTAPTASAKVVEQR